jgi:predicted phosphohydrolase
MMDQFSTLSPLKEAANILAEKTDWPMLYDQKQLEKNSIPVAAAVYTNDMYVDRHYSLETGQSINGIKIWETDDYEHNGLRSHGEKILLNLFELLD